MPKVGKTVVTELLSYLENEVNNRSLTVTAENGEPLDVVSAVYLDNTDGSSELQVMLADGPKRIGVTLKVDVTDEVEGL